MQAIASETRTSGREKIGKIPIERLRISYQTRMALKAVQIQTVQDIIEMENSRGLLRACNIKKVHYREIQNALREIGMTPNDGEFLILEEPADIAILNPIPEAKEETSSNVIHATSMLEARDKELPKTAVFVDYEHWYVSLWELHQRKPNIGMWFADMKTRGQLQEVNFFGNFSDDGGMKDEIANIRMYSNRIIETRNPSEHYKKDFTDFIILDNIYQKIITAPDVEQVVLFTGDGHFSSVASYLRNFCSKVVGVYGIDRAINKQLEMISDWCVRIPFVNEPYEECRRAILKNLKYVENHTKSATFTQTVRIVAENYYLPDDTVEAELKRMIEEGIVYSVSERSRWDYKVMLNILKVNWDLVEKTEI